MKTSDLLLLTVK